MNTAPVSTMLAEIHARAAKGARLHARVAQMTLADAEKELRADAAAVNAQWPQYAGHWDGWKLGTVRRRVETKAGVAFEKGDLCLYQPPRSGGSMEVVTAYSHRNGVDTSVPFWGVEAL